MVGGSSCLRYGQTGHSSRDCTATNTNTPVSDLILFHLSQRGHNKSYCLGFSIVGPVSEPAPTSLRITNGYQGQTDIPVVKSKAFHFMSEETHAVPNMVMSMYLLLMYLFILN